MQANHNSHRVSHLSRGKEKHKKKLYDIKDFLSTLIKITALSHKMNTQRHALLKCLIFSFYVKKEVKDNCKNNL